MRAALNRSRRGVDATSRAGRSQSEPRRRRDDPAQVGVALLGVTLEKLWSRYFAAANDETTPDEAKDVETPAEDAPSELGAIRLELRALRTALFKGDARREQEWQKAPGVWRAELEPVEEPEPPSTMAACGLMG